MKTRLLKLWDTLRSSYWFVPLVMMVAAVALWSVTNRVDHELSGPDKKPLTWLYIDDFDSMRGLLLAIAASIIGIVGVVFSIVMVPLTIAASQFGPRLLRTFLRDTGTQITLGTFTGTFVFSLLVLMLFRDETLKSLPQISANVALLLGLISFGMLIYFINHVAISIQAPVVVARVSDELNAAIDREFPNRFDALPNTAANEHAHDLPSDLKEAASKVIAMASGYVQARDDNTLLRLARKHNLVIQLLSRPGDFVVQGTPLAHIWLQAAAPKGVDIDINNAFILGSQRTLVQDVLFGINELVEVAVRALSPAINDPFTAMTCIDWLATALCRICSRAFPPSRLLDEEGHLRLITRTITFDDLTNAAFNQIREYGRTSMMVTLRLLSAIAAVAQCVCTHEQRAALQRHAELVERGCQIGLPEAADRQQVAAQFKVVLQLLSSSEKPEIRV